MTNIDNVGSGWWPAPGSVARHYWPLPIRWAWWLGHRPQLVVLVALAVLVAFEVHPVAVPVVAGVVAVVLVVWWRAHPASFHPTGGRVLLGLWRSFWAYGVRWRTAMMLSGLGGRFNGDEYVPRVVRVRAGRYCDRVTVRMVAGQQPADWGRRLDALAHAFGARSCQVRELRRRPGYLQLLVGRRDPLAQVVPALPTPAVVDLAAVPIGRREDGQPWTVPVRGSHTLIAGATGAGKGSVLQSMIRGLAPTIRDGLVKLWALDPKGGMELAAGRPLFDRFAHRTAAEFAGLLEEAVAVMDDRAARLMGITREHTPTTDEPLIVVLVDELAALTAYAARDERNRINAALAQLISRGRAVGVVIVAALQDSRKEIIPFRNLIPTRIALSLVEPDETDLVLGKGARDKGADCSRIPLRSGIGWVWCDGESEPARVRAAWVTDADIAHTAATYTPGTRPPAGDDDPVVIDLTDKTRSRQGREP
jgi:DNA segregation ATPase FtsK/SpoIIIE, S-DNA-T family